MFPRPTFLFTAELIFLDGVEASLRPKIRSNLAAPSGPAPAPLKSLCMLKVLRLMPAAPQLVVSSICDKTYSEAGWKQILQTYAEKCCADLALEDRMKLSALFNHDGKFHDLVLGQIGKDEQKNPINTFFRQLAAQTGLKELQINRSKATVTQGFATHYPTATTAVLLCLARFRSLKKLVILTYSVKNDDLTVISNYLKNLVELSVVLHGKVTKPGLEKMARLPALEYFIFCSPNHQQYRMADRINHCLLTMPRLKTIGQIDFEGFHDLSRFEDQVEVGLTSLQLKSDQVIPAHISLPNLTRLCLVADNDISLCNFDQYQVLPNISNIVIRGLKTQDIVTLILEKYGHKLEVLRIQKTQENSDPLSLRDILMKCAPLRILQVESCLLTFNSLEITPEIGQKFCRMEDLSLIVSSSEGMEKCPDNFLSNVFMQSSSLQKISVQGARIKDDDFNLLLKVLAQEGKKEEKRGKKLSSFGCDVYGSNDCPILGSVILKMLNSCPKLLEIHLFNADTIFFRDFLQRLQDILISNDIHCLKTHP